jgi:dnd system-associated protein 4
MFNNDWLKINVRRSKKYENVVDRLCPDEGPGIFRFKKDVMIFAAIVGYSNNSSVPVSGDTIPITLLTYSSDHKDTIIYLLALMSERDVSCLKNENLAESVKIFEGYCNAGLEVIQGWFSDNAKDPEGVDTLFEKIFEEICYNEKNQGVINDELEVDF